MCTNCLGINHHTINCKSTGCRQCSRKHHTFLHITNTYINYTHTDNVQILTESTENINVTAPTVGLAAACLKDTEVLLGTARIKILYKHNYAHECRILIDLCSQTKFITEQLAKKLQLHKHKNHMLFCGIGNSKTNSNYTGRTIITSSDSSFSYETTFVALPEISGELPSRQVNRPAIPITHNITLADPDFHKSSEIDVLFGNKLPYLLLRIGQIRLCNDNVALQNPD